MAVNDGVTIAIGNNRNLGSELFLKLEEGLKNLFGFVEIVVDDVDE